MSIIFISVQWKNSSTSVEHTAHVLLALSKCGDSLHGPLKVAASNAKLLSIRYENCYLTST